MKLTINRIQDLALFNKVPELRRRFELGKLDVTIIIIDKATKCRVDGISLNQHLDEPYDVDLHLTEIVTEEPGLNPGGMIIEEDKLGQ